MANEITITASLTYSNAAAGIVTAQQLAFANFVASITGKNFEKGTMLVPTTAGGTAIPISNLSTLGWACLYNIDNTNYADILTGVSGTAVIRLLADEMAVFRFAPGITAPAAKANTASILLQYLILEN